jgi:hypothetical protein
MKFWFIRAPFLSVSGMALFPFILVKKPALKYDPVFVNHELIHLRQQLELLILPFYIFYLFNYFINLLIYRNHYTAYLNIVFEREAYAMDKNVTYLKSRKFWAWTSFF